MSIKFDRLQPKYFQVAKSDFGPILLTPEWSVVHVTFIYKGWCTDLIYWPFFIYWDIFLSVYQILSAVFWNFESLISIYVSPSGIKLNYEKLNIVFSSLILTCLRDLWNTIYESLKCWFYCHLSRGWDRYIFIYLVTLRQKNLIKNIFIMGWSPLFHFSSPSMKLKILVDFSLVIALNFIIEIHYTWSVGLGVLILGEKVLRPCLNKNMCFT